MQEDAAPPLGPPIELAILAWVRTMGRTVRPGEAPWLDGPVSFSEFVGRHVFSEVAEGEGLAVLPSDADAGVIGDFDALRAPGFDPSAVDPRVRDFYEHTARYRLDVRPTWSPLFFPFVRMLIANVSPRMDQLNLPLTPWDAKGLTSEVVHLASRDGGGIRHRGWLRRLGSSGRVMFAGFYSVATPPVAGVPCVKTVFPVYSGNIAVFLRPVARDDGTYRLVSSGSRFGDSGFYRSVVAGGRTRVRYIRAFKETFDIVPEGSGLRVDHHVRFHGLDILTLRYAITRK